MKNVLLTEATVSKILRLQERFYYCRKINRNLLRYLPESADNVHWIEANMNGSCWLFCHLCKMLLKQHLMSFLLTWKSLPWKFFSTSAFILFKLSNWKTFVRVSKRKLRKQALTMHQRKNKMSRNKFNQGGERHPLWRL